jgi:peptide/nickel transport system substrate-binding protein
MMNKINRRQFLRVSALATAGALATACAVPAPEEAPAVEPPVEPAEPTAKPAEPTPEPMEEQPWPRGDVPRERTYIQVFQGSGGEYTDTGICGPWANGYCHQCGHASELEPLAYFSAHGNKEYPWLAESYKYSD